MKYLHKTKIITLIVVFSAILIIFIPFYSNAENKLVFKSNANNSMKIAITFDDGPHPKQTMRILDILKKYNVKATFFVIGINAKNYPHVLNKVIEGGHEVGNHTFTHKVLKSIPESSIRNELDSTRLMLDTLYSYDPVLLRPPCGLYDSSLINVAKDNGYKIILWTIDTHDWAHESVKSIVKNVLSNVSSGDIVLFHDYISGVDNTPEALEILIPRLIDLGYEFVTVSELLQAK